MTILPRQTGDHKSKERFISRVLSNQQIEPLRMMQGYVMEALHKLSASGATVYLNLGFKGVFVFFFASA